MVGVVVIVVDVVIVVPEKWLASITTSTSATTPTFPTDYNTDILLLTDSVPATTRIK